MRKKIVVLATLVTILICSFNFNVFAQEEISVFINNTKIEFDVNPQMINDRTMVPMRKIFEELGAKVDWDDSTQTATGTKDDTTVKISINDKTIYKNGTAETLDVPAQLIDKRTLVPVRAVSEALGVSVFWREEINTVSIHNSESDIEYIQMYNTKLEPIKVEKELKHLYTEIGWTDSVVNSSLDSGLTKLKNDILVYSKFDSIHSIDNILPGLNCCNHNEISHPEFDIYSYFYSYPTKTLEDAEKYAMQYARYLQSLDYRLICEMDNPTIIQSKGKDVVYELVSPDRKLLVNITSVYTHSYEPHNTVDVSIEYYDGYSKYATSENYYHPNKSVTMYAPDGRSVTIKGSEVHTYEDEGWYTYPVQTLYALGKSAVFKKSEVEAQLTVGWYTEPVQVLYAPGKTGVFKESEVEAQLTVGWYREPVCAMYAPDGRTITIPNDQVEAYKKVGWYKNAKDAIASKYPKQNVRILQITFDCNSVGGIEPTIIWRNDSGKTIKYIYFTCVPYNAVGDAVSCRISGKSYAILQSTGPYKTFTNADLEQSWPRPRIYFKRWAEPIGGSDGKYSVSCYDYSIHQYKRFPLTQEDYKHVYNFENAWDPIWYNYSVDYIKITKVRVIYMDGSSETISNPPIWREVFRNAGI